ncbi:trimethylamine methyltransferase family protein [Desulfobaculum sp.]
MPLDPMWSLTQDDISAVHAATINLLETTGIEFLSEQALDVFRSHSFKVEDQRVFITDEQVQAALSTCPSSFTVHARNEANNVVIGGERPIFSPVYGAPNVVDFDDNLRSGTLDDYHTLVKLAHQLPNQDMVGYLLCDPSDVPAETSYLQMLYSSFVYSDKPFMGCSTHGKKGVDDMLAMGEMVFGCDREEFKEKPFSISLINSLTPLRYEEKTCEALIELATYKQPMLIAALVTGGATGPISMGGVLVLQTAEVLAGIVLSQLVNPGTPVIYGCASGVMDMSTVVVAIGAPEFSKVMRAGVQLGHYYGLPCRGGGSLTDACDVDAQAGFESMSTMLNAMNLGADFIQHSSGCLSSYLGASFTKIVMDDEICGYGKAMRQKIDVSEEGLALDVIKEVGHGGEYLTNMHTALNCRTASWQPNYSYRKGLEAWFSGDTKSLKQTIRERGEKLLAEYQMPEMDPAVKAQLDAFVEAGS